MYVLCFNPIEAHALQCTHAVPARVPQAARGGPGGPRPNVTENAPYYPRSAQGGPRPHPIASPKPEIVKRETRTVPRAYRDACTVVQYPYIAM